jgi:hypothetical protein
MMKIEIIYQRTSYNEDIFRRHPCVDHGFVACAHFF